MTLKTKMNNTLIITGSMTTLNDYIDSERGNKFAAAKIKKNETERVAWECKKQKIDKVGDKRVYVYFKWFCENRKSDPDNICFAKKFILDGLVVAKVLNGDGQKHIAGFIDKFYVDDRPRVEVEIVSVL